MKIKEEESSAKAWRRIYGPLWEQLKKLIGKLVFIQYGGQSLLVNLELALVGRASGERLLMPNATGYKKSNSATWWSAGLDPTYELDSSPKERHGTKLSTLLVVAGMDPIEAKVRARQVGSEILLIRAAKNVGE